MLPIAITRVSLKPSPRWNSGSVFGQSFFGRLSVCSWLFLRFRGFDGGFLVVDEVGA